MVTRSTIQPLLILLGLLSLLILSACAGPAPAPTLAPSATPPRETATRAPTFTPFPTETPQPTLTPTITATVPPTITPTLTPDASLAEIKLIGLAWMMPQYDMLLSFQFPSAVDPSKYRVTLEDKEYKCQVLAQFPNRLYCIGQGAKVLTTATIRLYQVGSSKPAYEKDYWIPYFPKAK